PPCPMTVLEIDLAADRTLFADRDSAVVTGPLPGRAADRQLWRVALTGRSNSQPETLQLLLKHPAKPGQPQPFVRQLIQSTQKLSPGQADCEFEIDLIVQRGNLQALTLECDSGLRPYDVAMPGLDRWEASPLPDGRTQIQVRLREPFQGGRITIRTLSLLSAPDASWACPGVRVNGALSRGETLILRVHPDLKLD